MKNTLVVNLIAPAGSGKSTMSADIFAKLKWKNIDCELVTEFAKDLVWEERNETFKDEIYIFAKQFHRIFRLAGKVDVIITDRPLILSMFYNDEYGNSQFTQLNRLVLEQHYNFNNLNLFINRKKDYNENGRNQTEDESNQMGVKIRDMLDNNGIFYGIVDGTEESIEAIVGGIIYTLQSSK